MKYRQLTKEQFEALHTEFGQFLATQQIDVNEWNLIKAEKPKVAEEEMNIFSDMVWEDVLTKVQFLEHHSKNSINLFKCKDKTIERILIKINNSKMDLLEKEGYQWFLNNLKHNDIEYFKASKSYKDLRNIELFELIEKGSFISKGELYTTIIELIK